MSDRATDGSRSAGDRFHGQPRGGPSDYTYSTSGEVFGQMGGQFTDNQYQQRQRQYPDRPQRDDYQQQCDHEQRLREERWKREQARLRAERQAREEQERRNYEERLASQRQSKCKDYPQDRQPRR